VFSDIPALVFAGRYDPTTPPAYGQQVAQHLSHSYFFEIPDQAHAPTYTGLSTCPVNIVRAFLQNPDQEPDSTCLDATEPVHFLVPYTGNPAIKTATYTNTEANLTVEMPIGWVQAGNGFYNRSSSLLDVTQIGVQRSAVTPAEWLDWLAEVFYGKRGFDKPPVEVEQRQANSRTWVLYQTTLDGHPVDIAFAVEEDDTFMVLLYSYADERDALFRDVFYTAIETVRVIP
jgi:hypothetical protein